MQGSHPGGGKRVPFQLKKGLCVSPRGWPRAAAGARPVYKCRSCVWRVLIQTLYFEHTDFSTTQNKKFATKVWAIALVAVSRADFL
jgi:hypothetical protein